MKRQRFESDEKNEQFKKQRKKTNRQIRKDVHNYDIQQLQDAIERGTSLRDAKNGFAPNKCWIPQLRDENNLIISDRSKVLDIAAKFYENLYKSTLTNDEKTLLDSDLSEENEEVEKITVGELITPYLQ